jgi:uncharacterized protein
MSLVFEWDRLKATRNERKHGVSFDEAGTVFDDATASIFPDEDHSNSEQREIIVGHSILDRLLLVCFIERSPQRIRIISARMATRREQRNHEENTSG